jgi:hypothetical protein
VPTGLQEPFQRHMVTVCLLHLSWDFSAHTLEGVSPRTLSRSLLLCTPSHFLSGLILIQVTHG